MRFRKIIEVSGAETAQCTLTASASATAERRVASEIGFWITSWIERIEAVGALALIGKAGHQENGQVGEVARRG